jgi:glycosyltransferase involved in cell wall biosynthesis
MHCDLQGIAGQGFRTVSAPLVSVIIPFYKQEDFLLDAVLSVAAQTYEHLEIIVVDDCSPGPTAAELLEWRSIPRLNIIRHEMNSGVSAARNTAISNSSGQLILPLDADDLITPDYLEKSIFTLSAAPYASAVHTQVQVFGEQEWIWSPRFLLPDILFSGSPNTFLYRRELFEDVGGYKTHLSTYEDWDFAVSALERGWQFAGLSEPLYHYRKHSGGVTSTMERRDMVYVLMREHARLVDLFLEELIVEKCQRYWSTADAYETLRNYRLSLEHHGQGTGHQSNEQRNDNLSHCAR